MPITAAMPIPASIGATELILSAAPVDSGILVVPLAAALPELSADRVALGTCPVDREAVLNASEELEYALSFSSPAVMMT